MKKYIFILAIGLGIFLLPHFSFAASTSLSLPPDGYSSYSTWGTLTASGTEIIASYGGGFNTNINFATYYATSSIGEGGLSPSNGSESWDGSGCVLTCTIYYAGHDGAGIGAGGSSGYTPNVAAYAQNLDGNIFFSG
ncbi:MAG TPA: hypothetical protein VMA75_04590 [Candidatus Paceibacterota bacterium]|nr:hypothetical protein [Candidatus Paceibacterota bacterium]